MTESIQYTNHKIRHRDGADNTVHLYIPGERAYLVYLFLPAMGVRASYYKLCAEKLATRGVASAVVDWRGHGQSSERAGRDSNWGYKQLVFDLYDTIKWLKKRIGFYQLMLIGHSMGGQVAHLVAARYPDLVDGVIGVASSDPWYRMWPQPHATGMKLASHLTGPVSKLVGHFPGYLFGFAKREARSVIGDWAFAVRTGVFNLLEDEFDYLAAKKEYRGKILHVGIKDDILAPEKAIQHTASKFPLASENEIIMLDGNQDAEKQDHFSWVKYPDRIFDHILT